MICKVSTLATFDWLFIHRDDGLRGSNATHDWQELEQDEARVARCIFKPKILIWVNYGGPLNGKGCYILRPLGIYYGHLVYFNAIWQLSGNLVYGPQFWYIVSRKIWQSWMKPFLLFLIANRNTSALWSRFLDPENFPQIIFLFYETFGCKILPPRSLASMGREIESRHGIGRWLF
jgi:hypothetical protein